MPPSSGILQQPLLFGFLLLPVLLFIPSGIWQYCIRNLPYLNSVYVALVRDETTGISYQGVVSNGNDNFFNIFYADDTSGPNRFAPPRRLYLPTGTLVDATAPGAVCPQGLGDAAFPFTSPVTNISENCLSLRITRPHGTAAGAKLPVVVWIHGGGFALGTAYDQLYDHEGLVRQASQNGQPIVFVGINYRLGMFGFAANGALRKSKHGNNGLRDQHAAFEWIHDNIGAFGGDPDNIVAMGQSVGASSIGLHLTSHKGIRGVPFQKAIMMSGASGLNFNVNSDLVANNTATVARSLDCIKSDPDSTATIACLQEVPMEKLMNVSVAYSRQLRPPFGELSFYPSYDADYIMERPSLSLRSGNFVKGIPLIASWVANDGAWYPPPSTSDDASVLASFSTFIANFSHQSLEKFLAVYPASEFEHMVPPGSSLSPHYYRAAQINRDMWFTCPVLDFTWQYAKHGSAPSNNVRIYEMNQTRFGPVFDTIGVPFWRVSHLSDIPYALNNHVAGGGDNSAEQKRLAAQLSSSIAAFAYSGDPTQSQSKNVLSDWPPAYERITERDYPDEVTINVIGGPVGTGSAKVMRKGAAHSAEGDADERVKALEWEQILERCEFINSIADEIGV